MNQRIAFALICTAFLGACTHSIHQVSTSDFEPYRPMDRGRAIKAEAEQFVVLGIVDNTNYVDEAYRSLQQQCTSGHISAITTEIATSHGFFSWTNRAYLQALCFSKAPETARVRKKRG